MLYNIILSYYANRKTRSQNTLLHIHTTYFVTAVALTWEVVVSLTANCFEGHACPMNVGQPWYRLLASTCTKSTGSIVITLQVERARILYLLVEPYACGV